ncbi:hypothetical protein HOY82DRAFT_619604 [Tuber indicum]|nr:hypothetical protein HOY82DRAFT_619604 [Tuber indicum]
MIQTLVTKARTLLIDAKLLTAIPDEMLNRGKKTLIHYLQRVGSAAYTLILPPQRTNKNVSERSLKKRMIKASNVILDEGKRVGNASCEDVLKVVLPEEVYSDEEEEGGLAITPKMVEIQDAKPNESPTSQAGIGGIPGEVNTEAENMQEQMCIEDIPPQTRRTEEKRNPDPKSDVSLHRSSRIQENAGLIETSSSLKTDALQNMVETL